MPDLVMFALVVLATTRLVGLWLDDELTRPVRDRVLAFLGGHRGEGTGGAAASWLLELVTCAWCVSIWFGAGVAAFAYYLPSNPVVVIGLMALAASQVTGWFGDVGRT